MQVKKPKQVAIEQVKSEIHQTITSGSEETHDDVKVIFRSNHDSNDSIKQESVSIDVKSEINNHCIFNKQLCEAFISADIPLRKLNTGAFSKCLQKYTGRSVPDQSTLGQCG